MDIKEVYNNLKKEIENLGHKVDKNFMIDNQDIELQVNEFCMTNLYFSKNEGKLRIRFRSPTGIKWYPETKKGFNYKKISQEIVHCVEQRKK